MKNSDVNENRLKQIEDLSDFIESKEIWLSELLAKTGWTLESLIEKTSTVQCPYDSNHWIAPSVMENHVKTCSLITKGYSKEDLEKEPPCSNVCYEKSTSVVPVHIDKNVLHTIIAQVNAKNGKQYAQKRVADMILTTLFYSNMDEKELPETMDRYFTEFSSEERLAIYDYVMEKAKADKKETDVSVQDLMVDFKAASADSEKPKTYLEMLAEKRDYKRRRQSYRAKNVHVTRKSYTEVMKEVIGNQMQYLLEIQKEEEEEEEQNPGSYRVKSDESNDQKASDLDVSEQTKNESDDSREERSRKRVKKHHHHHKHKRSHSKHREKHKKKSK